MGETKQSTFYSESSPDSFLKFADSNHVYDLNCLYPPKRLSYTDKLGFFSAYQKACPNQVYHFAEIVKDEGPIRVDVDMKELIRNENELKSLHSFEDIRKVVDVVQKAIENMTRPFANSVELKEAQECVVLTKKPYITEPDAEGRIYVKHGFHLHFPKTIVDNFHLKQILSHVRDASGFDVDLDAVKNSWLLYGSSKKEGLSPYLVEKILDSSLNEIEVETFAKTMQTFKKDDLRLPFDWPIVLSVDVLDRAHFYKRKLNNQFLTSTPTAAPVVKADRKLVSPEESEKVLHQLKPYLKLINTRIIGYQCCVDFVGNAIHNETGGSEEGFALWKEWKASLREKDCDEEDCSNDEEDWNNFQNERQMIFGYIVNLAKKCNPEKFQEMDQFQFLKPIKTAIFGGEREMAWLTHFHYKNKYVCSNTSTKDGYFFNKELHLWEFYGNAQYLKTQFLNVEGDWQKIDLLKGYGSTVQQTLRAFENMCDLKTIEEDEEDKVFLPPPRKKRVAKRKTKKVVEEDEEEPQGMTLNELYKIKAHDLRVKMSGFSYMNAMLNLISVLLFQKEFTEKLDTHPHLIAFKNGVVNLLQRDEDGEFIVRPGVPEDMLSLKVEANFQYDDPVKGRLTEDSQDVKDVRKFFTELFPDETVRDYVIGCLSLCFYGHNTEKIICFFTGSGNNGKSLLNKLMASLFNNLCTEVNVNLFKEKKDAESATPQLAKMGKKRLVQVPEAMATIAINLLKRLTGDDKISARLLQKNDNSFDPMCQIHFSSNALPQLVDFDSAMKTRVRVIEFKSQFVEKYIFDSYSEEERKVNHIYLMDPHLRDKISMDAFAYVLMKSFKENFGNRIVPNEVLLSSDAFSADNNVYEMFVRKFIRKGGVEDRVLLDFAFEEFKRFARTVSLEMTLNKISFKDNVSKILNAKVERLVDNKTEVFWRRHSFSSNFTHV